MEQSLHEKLTGSQLVKKFPAFYGTWRFVTLLSYVNDEYGILFRLHIDAGTQPVSYAV